MNFNAALFRDAITIFQGIVVEAIPFVILGVLASAFIHVYVSSKTLLKFIPKSRLGRIFFGPMMGFLFPVCECGNIPLARRMILKGVPLHVVVGFLLAAPVFNPIVILATIAAFPNQPQVVLLRIGLSLAIALTLSGVFSLIKDPKALLNQKLAEEKLDENCSHEPGKPFGKFLRTAGVEFLEMTGMLILGAFIASFFQVVISRETLVSLGKGPVSSVMAMMLLAAVISICSNVDAFFALSYVNHFTFGSVMAFLVFGPMIDIKVIIMLNKIFRPKVVAYLATLVTLLSFLIFVFYNLNIS